MVSLAEIGKRGQRARHHQWRTSICRFVASPDRRAERPRHEACGSIYGWSRSAGDRPLPLPERAAATDAVAWTRPVSAVRVAEWPSGDWC